MTDERARSDPAVDRFRAIGARAAGVAHDLINILAGIEAAAADALAAGGAVGPAAGPLHEIQGYTERAAAMVREVLGHSREDAAPPVALGECLAGVARLLRRLLGAGIELTLLHETPGPEARIRRTDFERVMTNLAANARDAMPHGGELVVRIAETPTAPATATGGVQPRPQAVIEVADTGAGIAPELLGQVSEPFFTTKKAGTGLGLATVRDIVGRVGGSVFIDSALGQGTRVRVHLPLALDQAEGGAKTEAGVPTGDGSVLLVEDEDAIRRVAERGLRERGWQVLAAASAEQAQFLLGRGEPQRPALLISDFALPGRDGLALLTELRRAHRGLPAILTSGYADEALRRACAEADAALLIKPYALRALLDKAAEMVRAAASHRAEMAADATPAWHPPEEVVPGAENR